MKDDVDLQERIRQLEEELEGYRLLEDKRTDIHPLTQRLIRLAEQELAAAQKGRDEWVKWMLSPATGLHGECPICGNYLESPPLSCMEMTICPLDHYRVVDYAYGREVWVEDKCFVWEDPTVPGVRPTQEEVDEAIKQAKRRFREQTRFS